MDVFQILSERLLRKICMVFVFNALLFNITGNSTVRAQETLADEVIEIKSGNGEVGSRDNSVTFNSVLEYAQGQRGLNSSDFQSAVNGTHAFIVTPFESWISNLHSVTNAKWIATTQTSSETGQTALYAIPFTIHTRTVNSVRFEINFAVDDMVIYSDKTGMFVNQSQLICPEPVMIGNFGSESIVNCTVEKDKLLSGGNTFFFLVSNAFGPSGLIFNIKILINPKDFMVLGATTEFNPSPTPSPSPSPTPTTLTPTPVQEAAGDTSTKGGSELPQTGVNINFSLALLAVGIWSFYFYLKYKII